MASERGLGRGLGALLGDAALQTQEGGSVLLPIAQVEPGLKQPRKRFDEETLADLALHCRACNEFIPARFQIVGEETTP